MIRFLTKITMFMVPLITVFLIGIFLPTTPRASKSLLMASINKNSLLQNSPSPRIIFVGGSNLSFGLNSQLIKDSLHINPINTAIHAAIGIKFMIDNTLGYIQNGDIVVLVPEYNHFYSSLNSGSEELMRIIFDANFKNIEHLNIYQIANIIPYLPNYCLTKFKANEYLNVNESDIYSVNSFNQFGDTYTHWGMKQQDFSPYGLIGDKLNCDVIKYFQEFSLAVNERGAVLFISFPCFQETSFNNSKEQIFKIEQELLNSNLAVIGSSKMYIMPDSFMFNTPYHLNKKGVDYRTKIIIEQIKKVLTQNSIYKK